MAGLRCPHCGEEVEVFPRSAGAVDLENEGVTAVSCRFRSTRRSRAPATSGSRFSSATPTALRRSPTASSRPDVEWSRTAAVGRGKPTPLGRHDRGFRTTGRRDSDAAHQLPSLVRLRLTSGFFFTGTPSAFGRSSCLRPRARLRVAGLGGATYGGIAARCRPSRADPSRGNVSPARPVGNHRPYVASSFQRGDLARARTRAASAGSRCGQVYPRSMTTADDSSQADRRLPLQKQQQSRPMTR